LFEVWTFFRKAFFSLLLLVIVVGGIVAGVFTATEASVIAVLYAAVLSLIYGDMKIKHFSGVLLSSAKTTAVVMFLICTSMAMSWLFSFEGIPEMISTFLLESLNNKFAIFLAINIILLVVGTFMDMTPALLIFTPILLPVAHKLGISDIHFGIIMIANLCIGLCTPPVGTCLFIGCSVGKTTIAKVTREALPFFGAMVVALLLITYIPWISTLIPKLCGLMK
jgi:tripartite ATP-independent transporter DctM subunit